MINEFGHFLLILALALAIVQAVVPMLGALWRDRAVMQVGDITAWLIFFMVLGAFLALIYAYLSSDFSLLNVWQNSHSRQPLIYKITSVWGNHEGSMLLWVLILALFSCLASGFGRGLPKTFKANLLSVQAWIMVAFLLFILFTSNPFLRLEPCSYGRPGP